jgi:uncharacterized protein
MASNSFASLTKHQFINLTTYRKNGQAVATPVWFAPDGDRLVGFSHPQAGKIKRIRNNPRVSVAPSTVNGKALGESIEGVARLLSPEEWTAAKSALKRKYGFQFRLLAWFSRVRHSPEIFWEVRPVG